MGKVYKYAALGYAGEISRAGGDHTTALANADSKDIGFGMPVFWNEARTGAVGISATSKAEDFIGITVRSGAKTPPVYDDPSGKDANSKAVYEPGEIMDVMTEGNIIMACSGSGPKRGTPVYLNKEYGIASATSSDSTLTVEGLKFKSERDSNGMVEVCVLVRHSI